MLWRFKSLGILIIWWWPCIALRILLICFTLDVTSKTYDSTGAVPLCWRDISSLSSNSLSSELVHCMHAATRGLLLFKHVTMATPLVTNDKHTVHGATLSTNNVST
jgi:hypothetical protein